MRRKSNKTNFGPNVPTDYDDLETLVATPRSRSNPLLRSSQPVRSLRQSEDRRRWAPGLKAEAPREKPRDTRGRSARFSHQSPRVAKVLRGPGGKPLQSRPTVIGRVEKFAPRFAEARKTYICLKRAMRRQVLFALKHTRKGAGSPKRRNEWSNIQCSTR